jgi:hypothetical protein
MSEFSKDDKSTFRKRVIGIILATDMARHVSDLGAITALLENNQVQSSTNLGAIFDKSSATNEFDSK